MTDLKDFHDNLERMNAVKSKVNMQNDIDNFAIEFLLWASQYQLQRFDDDKWQVLGLMDFGFTKTVSTREILEQFKKERK